MRLTLARELYARCPTSPRKTRSPRKPCDGERRPSPYSSPVYLQHTVAGRSLMNAIMLAELANWRRRNNALDTLVAHRVAVVHLLHVRPAVLVPALISPATGIVIAANNPEPAGDEQQPQRSQRVQGLPVRANGHEKITSFAHPRPDQTEMCTRRDHPPPSRRQTSTVRRRGPGLMPAAARCATASLRRLPAPGGHERHACAGER